MAVALLCFGGDVSRVPLIAELAVQFEFFGVAQPLPLDTQEGGKFSLVFDSREPPRDRQN